MKFDIRFLRDLYNRMKNGHQYLRVLSDIVYAYSSLKNVNLTFKSKSQKKKNHQCWWKISVIMLTLVNLNVGRRLQP